MGTGRARSLASDDARVCTPAHTSKSEGGSRKAKVTSHHPAGYADKEGGYYYDSFASFASFAVEL